MSDKKSPGPLTCDKAKECLQSILEWIRNEDAKSSLFEDDICLSQMGGLKEAREAAGNDMVALMTLVYPLIAHLTAKAIAPLGYSQNGAGVLQFERAVQSLLPQDADLARLHSELRSYYLPAIVFPAPHDSV